jgi:hypothetical protein
MKKTFSPERFAPGNLKPGETFSQDDPYTGRMRLVEFVGFPAEHEGRIAHWRDVTGDGITRDYSILTARQHQVMYILTRD